MNARVFDGASVINVGCVLAAGTYSRTTRRSMQHQLVCMINRPKNQHVPWVIHVYVCHAWAMLAWSCHVLHLLQSQAQRLMFRQSRGSGHKEHRIDVTGITKNAQRLTPGQVPLPRQSRPLWPGAMAMHMDAPHTGNEAAINPRLPARTNSIYAQLPAHLWPLGVWLGLTCSTYQGSSDPRTTQATHTTCHPGDDHVHVWVTQ